MTSHSQLTTQKNFFPFPENNEFGEVKPTPVLRNNHQGKRKEFAYLLE